MSTAPRQRGLAIVEFAIVLPVLLLLLLATAEIVRAITQYSTLAHAVRNSVRHVAGKALLGSTETVVVSPTLIAEAKNLVVYGNASGTGSARLPGLTVGQVTVANAGGGNVSVTAAYPYQPLLGGTLPTFGFGPPLNTLFTMTVANTMRAL